MRPISAEAENFIHAFELQSLSLACRLEANNLVGICGEIACLPMMRHAYLRAAHRGLIKIYRPSVFFGDN